MALIAIFIAIFITIIVAIPIAIIVAILIAMQKPYQLLILLIIAWGLRIPIGLAAKSGSIS